MVTRSTLARGTRAGVQTALGAASGLFVHAAAVALGVSALLFLTLLPQFLSPSWSSGRALPLALALATIPATCSFTGLSLYALGLARLRPLLRRPRVRRAQDRILGCVLIALGARLAAERA
jgi:threonine/homoserine/homoserine lactone efflux protein